MSSGLHPAIAGDLSSALVASRSHACFVAGDVEIPWWTYGARGMQLWFPSSLAEPLSPSLRDQQHLVSTDPELEFDREVYPIGISISEVAIIGQYCATLPATLIIDQSVTEPGCADAKLLQLCASWRWSSQPASMLSSSEVSQLELAMACSI